MRNHELALYVLCAGFLTLAIFNGVKYMEVAKQLNGERMARSKCDSMLYAYHYIPEQVQELLTGNPDSANIYHTIVSESGGFNSQQFQRNRNLFGFHNGQDYLKFNHWRESFDYFMTKMYCDMKPGESYCSFLRRKKFGSNGVVNYCPGK